MSENKNAKTPTDDGQPVAWTPQVWRQFRPDGTLEFQKIKRTPNGEWEDYTAPPKQWVGLTDEDYKELSKSAFVEVIEKIERVLKEKNT